MIIWKISAVCLSFLGIDFEILQDVDSEMERIRLDLDLAPWSFADPKEGLETSP
jgi:hypothetical protein